jgi:hypothetical protein
MRSIRITAAAAFLFLAGGWGSAGHRVINGDATLHLPPEMAAFVAQRAWLADSASVADWRRSGYNGYVAVPSDAPKHYLDVDDYPEHITRSVTTDLSALIAQFGISRVTQNGTLPWAVGDAVDTLTAALQRRDLGKAWSTAADLGHYVGDGHNPLHCTVDYNGRTSLPGSSGIHSRYESSMVSRYSGSLIIEPDTAVYVADPVAFALGFVYDSQQLVDTLYAADVAARGVAGWNGSGTPPSVYLDALWSFTGDITRSRFQSASKALASLLYTAWIDAGSPDLSAATGVSASTQDPSAFFLHEPYPNPFNPVANVVFRLDVPSNVRMDLVGMDGRSHAVLAEGLRPAGEYRVSVDASALRLASGLYVVRLAAGDGRQPIARKLLLLR